MEQKKRFTAYKNPNKFYYGIYERSTQTFFVDVKTISRIPSKDIIGDGVLYISTDKHDFYCDGTVLFGKYVFNLVK